MKRLFLLCLILFSATLTQSFAACNAAEVSAAITANFDTRLDSPSYNFSVQRGTWVNISGRCRVISGSFDFSQCPSQPSRFVEARYTIGFGGPSSAKFQVSYTTAVSPSANTFQFPPFTTLPNAKLALPQPGTHYAEALSQVIVGNMGVVYDRKTGGTVTVL